MEEKTNVTQAIEEIKSADEEHLKKVIEEWFERTRTDGMKIGAYFVSAAVAGAIEKNLKDGMKSSHRDFERAIKRVMEIVSVQLKQDETVQNDSTTEEVANDE
jgi:hypothetical protein